MLAIVALGANIGGRWGAPADTLRRAGRELSRLPGTRLVATSRLWRSAPFGGVPQPAFLNAVALLRTALPPHALLRHLQELERAAGRRQGVSWGPRALDLDLLDHAGRVMRPVGMGRLAKGRAAHRWQKRGLILPHPGIAERPFVLLPLVEIAPNWRHPLLGAHARALLLRLPHAARAQCRPLPGQDSPSTSTTTCSLV